jgi:hypothetical protein
MAEWFFYFFGVLALAGVMGVLAWIGGNVLEFILDMFPEYGPPVLGIAVIAAFLATLMVTTK